MGVGWHRSCSQPWPGACLGYFAKLFFPLYYLQAGGPAGLVARTTCRAFLVQLLCCRGNSASLLPCELPLLLLLAAGAVRSSTCWGSWSRRPCSERVSEDGGSAAGSPKRMENAREEKLLQLDDLRTILREGRQSWKDELKNEFQGWSARANTSLEKFDAW